MPSVLYPRAGLILLAIAICILVGCAGGPTPTARRALDWQSEEVTQLPAVAPALPRVLALAAPVTNPPVASAPKEQFSGTWVPVARWCRSVSLPEPACLATTPLPSYALTTTNGTFTFRAGSQTANWAGVELRLGFAPQWIDRQPYLHTLDLNKTVKPLLSGMSMACSNSRPVLVLDPGHGGEDSGTRSALGHDWEKQFTLDWARRVQSLLATNGWDVFLTRDNDRELGLSNRVAFADQHRADLFLSLHFNSAAADAGQAGLETYCLTPAGMPSSITRGYEDDARLVFPNNAYDAQNLQLALRLHRTLLQVNGHLDRGVRRARFLSVLRTQQRPAVLIEGGYLSNKREARLISDPAYRQKLAEAVVRGLGIPL
jgi:N-acetylmuramoyl-L-alanine amidase